MKAMFVMLACLFGMAAQAQVLGELKGEGSIQAAYAGFDGSKQVRNGTCKVAMNIHQGATSFALDFSVFECSFLTPWNDAPVSYKIVGDKLVDAQGVQKGSVLVDGAVQFAESASTVQKYRQDTYDFNCRLLYSETKQLTLTSKYDYFFKRNADGSWSVRRQTSEDRLGWKGYRSQPNCPATTIPVKLGSTTDLKVIVK